MGDFYITWGIIIYYGRFLRNMGDFYIVWGILLWWSLPDSDSLGPVSDFGSDSLENDFLYVDFYITWGIFT